jgi:hypothetical protein
VRWVRIGEYRAASDPYADRVPVVHVARLRREYRVQHDLRPARLEVVAEQGPDGLEVVRLAGDVRVGIAALSP